MYLGIDIGTSGVKAVLVDESGAPVEQQTAPLSVSRPRALWSEQEPETWWSATTAAVTELPAAARRVVRGVGLSGQMHGATLLDAQDRPLRPAILWNDGRSGAECRELEERVPRSRQITGNLAMPGFTAPKLLWVRKHEPEVFAQVASVLLPKDYVRLRMTGDRATDLSDAAGTLWVDVERRAWSAEMLDACALGEKHMPRLYEGSQATGQLRADVAQRWGIATVPVAAGGGDNAAGAAGMGVIAPGAAFLSLGTSGVTFLADDRYRSNPARAVHAFCHCLPKRWHQMSVMLSAASCIDWVAALTGQADAGRALGLVEVHGKPARSEIFLPYLTGERTPHNNPHAQGVFFGLTSDTDSAALIQSVLEGVAFALAEGFDALKATGARISSVSVIGGGARSNYWGRILASALNTPLEYREGGEVGPAFGAARLARIAVTGEAPETVCKAPALKHTIAPQNELVAAYAGRRARFADLYRRLEPTFAENVP
jgi:xylulokinase